ncbi:hypothetical protein BDV96DRAFT_87955 [Lophiotrema nucula]|uniref:Zn(2)-C6 fungal-type domain-containing protein n=1 Tax=Lophiotrema nucula TaxID=690887 RepID=A0A6A5Z964_9PLEO|nr:hypothetical protein BDV96DRAFT_87955 [Lophiotrema nucula]
MSPLTPFQLFQFQNISTSSTGAKPWLRRRLDRTTIKSSFKLYFLFAELSLTLAVHSVVSFTINQPVPRISITRSTWTDMSETKVYKKRPHRKVKSGCATCKRRKIKVRRCLFLCSCPQDNSFFHNKYQNALGRLVSRILKLIRLTHLQCDEEKPQCGNCARYSAECVYPSPSAETPRDPASASTSTTPPPIQTPESIVEEPPIAPCPPGVHDLPVRDLALMHQWSVSTCFGFGDDFAGDADPWRVDVPIMGQHHHFLMRGILAVTALHLSRMALDPAVKIKYVQLAAYHQDLALPEYRAAIVNVTEDNVAAILAFSALTTVYSFAVPKDHGSSFSGGAPEWVFLHRGVGEIPVQWQAWIDRSPLQHEMHRRRLGIIDTTVNPEDYRLMGLHGMFISLSDEEQGETVYYENALHWLRQAFAHTFSMDSRLGSKYAVLFWVERVEQGYLELLAMHKPRALILLAHCAILLKRASKFWYFEGFAEHVVSELKPYLSEEFLPWMEWPLQEIGMV